MPCALAPYAQRPTPLSTTHNPPNGHACSIPPRMQHPATHAACRRAASWWGLGNVPPGTPRTRPPAGAQYGQRAAPGNRPVPWRQAHGGTPLILAACISQEPTVWHGSQGAATLEHGRTPLILAACAPQGPRVTGGFCSPVRGVPSIGQWGQHLSDRMGGFPKITAGGAYNHGGARLNLQ